jgi:hypothetical protein
MTAKVHAMTGQTHATCNTRQATYDLRKLRGKQLVGKPARIRRYYLPGPAARTISALLTLRDHVIGQVDPDDRIRHRNQLPKPAQPGVAVTIPARNTATVAHERPPSAMGHRAR